MKKSDLPQPLPADATGGMRLGYAVFFNITLHWTLALGFIGLAWALGRVCKI